MKRYYGGWADMVTGKVIDTNVGDIQLYETRTSMSLFHIAVTLLLTSI